ncbi:glycerol-3-phosphate cytidylyltransferase [Litoreibacter halocynthiae]|uniref:Glycerol-3-phosphate cytidylyltransferase n=1 Tax=Litoreibacter halocynthiae TaxID=1242689 RepID=A0A4R7LD66_9RHOB|nr:adenylyltransferase/cytidyltransferase family protein [Litoreibacter halocynthiae]TDT73134.1 glycerol-3-phosphate cytidylyltransferase [Litoreibacter halocynthiae]
MSTVITYGTFDLFHIGHLRILERAAQLGDRLIVGVSTDEFNALKGKKCVIPYEHRSSIVGAIKCVDLVIPENNWEQKSSDIELHGADYLVMGSDWEGKFDNFSNKCEVKYLERTSDVSTTSLKEALSSVSEEKIAEIQKGLDQIRGVIGQLGQ